MKIISTSTTPYIINYCFYSWLIAVLDSKIEMDESKEDPCLINRNKRKSQDENLDLPEPKHTCLEKSIAPSNIPSDIISHSRYNQTEEGSEKDSNSFLEDADPVMSVFNGFDIQLNYMKICPQDHHSASSVNWSGRLETKTCDEVSTNPAYDFYVSPDFEEQMLDCEENETKIMEDEDAGLEDFFCSNGVIPDNFVLSSGRWNINQDDEQGIEKMTIDKEFEQYFSMLML